MTEPLRNWANNLTYSAREVLRPQDLTRTPPPVGTTVVTRAADREATHAG